MARTKYNHLRRILNQQPGYIKSAISGMIIMFKYIGEKVSDKKPIVLVLHNDYQTYKLHGINLNYLTERQIKEMINRLSKGVGSDDDDNITITKVDQDESEYDDNLPNRNLLGEEFTQIGLPYFKAQRGGQPMSKSEATRKMKLLYEKHLKKYVNKYDMYRTYSYDKIKQLRVLNYDTRGLLK
tara:strand:+ start:1497 stop:2045 length:549 start_codon:yes stop_codon:yes gene_type:complete